MNSSNERPQVALPWAREARSTLRARVGSLALALCLAGSSGCTRASRGSPQREQQPAAAASHEPPKEPNAALAHEPLQRAFVAVGGTVGFESFANPASSERLRATGKAVLYIHSDAWHHITDDTKRSVVKAFAGTGPQVLEDGAGGPDTWTQEYPESYVSVGVHADQVHVDGIERITLEKWQAYVDAARAVGVKICSPIFSPNGNQWKTDPFASARWDDVRAKALYGGGITIDSPSSFFMKGASGYQGFVEDEIRWARQNGLQATYIISPNVAGNEFLSFTKALVEKLKEDDALPTFYVVENYRPLPGDPDYPNPVGPEQKDTSIAAVAIWVAENAPVAAPSNAKAP